MADAPESIVQPREALEQLWDHVQEHFDNDAAHDAFIQACVESREIAFAASKYRKAEEEDAGSERAARCRAQLERLVGHALSMLEQSRSGAPKINRVITLVAALVSGGIILACLLAMSR